MDVGCGLRAVGPARVSDVRFGGVAVVGHAECFSWWGWLTAGSFRMNAVHHGLGADGPAVAD